MEGILTDMDYMPFGMHKGKLLANVPDQYLLWLWENKNEEFERRFSELYAYIQQSLDAIKVNIERKK